MIAGPGGTTVGSKAGRERMVAGSIAAGCGGSGADWHVARESAAKGSYKVPHQFLHIALRRDVSESPLKAVSSIPHQAGSLEAPGRPTSGHNR